MGAGQVDQSIRLDRPGHDCTIVDGGPWPFGSQPNNDSLILVLKSKLARFTRDRIYILSYGHRF